MAVVKEEAMLKGLSYGIPKWLADALGAPWSKGTIQTLDGRPGFDHVRTYKSRVVISQPYEANGELGETLAKLHKQGICIKLWGQSPYFSGRTFSIVLWREEDSQLAKEITILMAKGRPEIPAEPTYSQWIW
jgi:hypothetical protein